MGGRLPDFRRMSAYVLQGASGFIVGLLDCCNFVKGCLIRGLELEGCLKDALHIIWVSQASFLGGNW